MKTISFVSFKGGAGKTTSLRLLASVLNGRERRVGLFDADENRPLAAWETYATGLGTWDAEKFHVYEALDEGQMETAIEAATGDGMEYALVDTHGGGSDLNQLILLNSDLIVIPTDLCVGELDEALKTMEYVLRLLKLAGIDIPTGFLPNRTPVDDGKLATAEREGIELLGGLPVFDVRLPVQRCYKDIKGSGPLNLYHARLKADPTIRFRSVSILVALGHAEAFTDEILRSVRTPEPA